MTESIGKRYVIQSGCRHRNTVEYSIYFHNPNTNAMTRFAALPVFALIFCIASLGFVLGERDGTNAKEVVISVSSETGRAVFDVHYETESALSVGTEDGVTPMTFTVEAENFSGVVRPRGNASLEVEVTRDGPDATRTSPTPTRIVKKGGDITLSRAQSE